MTKEPKKDVYDLSERTVEFGEKIIEICQKVKKDEISRPIISQLIRSSTSIGANYCEADCSESKKDFEHKIGICSKETKETRHWVRMLAKTVPSETETLRKMWQEAHELNLIFVTIIKNSKQNRTIREMEKAAI